MRMNRRNVLIGMGTIVAGGGAALGTGAFSTVEAERTVEVNIIDEGDIAEEFVDVIFKPDDYDSVDTDEEVDSVDSGDGISLIANDVTLVFGADGNDLPPNSIINYDDLFTVDNENNEDEPRDFEVTFEVDAASTFEFGLSGSDNFTEEYSTEVDNDDSEDIDLKLETADVTESDATLTIRIEEAE